MARICCPVARDFAHDAAHFCLCAGGRTPFGAAFPPQLFDLENDPLELHDRGRDPGAPYAAARDDLVQLMFDWMRARRNRIAMTDETVNKRPSPSAAGGVKIGIW